jgi:hypothetical protein
MLMSDVLLLLSTLPTSMRKVGLPRFGLAACLTEPGFVHRTIAGRLEHEMLFIYAMVRGYEAGEGVSASPKRGNPAAMLISYDVFTTDHSAGLLNRLRSFFLAHADA